MVENDNISWARVERLVMSELKKLDERTSRIETQVNKIYVELGVLKFKSSMLGLISGAIPSAIAVIWIIANK